MTTPNTNLLAQQLERAAVTRYSRGDLDGASRRLEALLEMQPDRSELWTLLGVCHRRQRQRNQALRAFRRAVQADPEDVHALLQLGEMLCASSRPVEGIPLLRAVFEKTRVEGLPPAEQPELTRRAGATLEAIQMTLRKWADTQRDAQT